MSEPIKDALMQETLKISQQYRENTAIKHGLPTQQRQTPVGEVPASPPVPPAPTPFDQTPADLVGIIQGLLRRMDSLEKPSTKQPSPGSPDPSPPGQLPQWLKGAAVGLGLLGSSAAGIGIGSWLNKPADPPSPALPSVVIERQGSLLQYLEDNGMHLPPGESP